jgi:hypothetical protein
LEGVSEVKYLYFLKKKRAKVKLIKRLWKEAVRVNERALQEERDKQTEENAVRASET